MSQLCVLLLLVVCFSTTVSITSGLASSSLNDIDSPRVNISNSKLNTSVSSKSRTLLGVGGVNNLMDTTLPFVMKPLGLIECETDLDGVGPFYVQILGFNATVNKTEDHVCGPTCRGDCVARPRDVGIPPSIYPFGCKCAQLGCNLNGPIVAPLPKSIFKIDCRPEPRCTCIGMGRGHFAGYSCQWINTRSGLPITYTEKAAVTLPGTPGRPPIRIPGSNFIPVRWCSCCPRIPVFRS